MNFLYSISAGTVKDELRHGYFQLEKSKTVHLCIKSYSSIVHFWQKLTPNAEWVTLEFRKIVTDAHSGLFFEKLSTILVALRVFCLFVVATESTFPVQYRIYIQTGEL